MRGWRPDGRGGLELKDGVFLETLRAAEADDRDRVLVIEEINRGAPSQIFGELLTLLENTKRNKDEALRLAYPLSASERVYVPANLHIVGTMNLADRSLALVDLALRRRFAFVTLKPALNGPWRDWCAAAGADRSFVERIASHMAALNAKIAADRALGEQFQVGHSYVTPSKVVPPQDWDRWWRTIVETEIAPLLAEYWYDDTAKVTDARGALLQGF